MHLVAYLRVSSSEQAQDNTIELQREQVAEWAEREGHLIVSWHEDNGVSGSNGLESRHGLAGAFGALPDADGLVVYRLDRLARDLVLQEQLLIDVRKMGKRLYSTVDAEDAYLVDDPKDPTRKLIRQILGAVSEYERGLIRLRLEAGRERKRAAGGYIGGPVPLGYRLEDDRLVPHEQEQAAIALARKLREEGLSLRAIGGRLIEAGYRPRGRKHRPWSAEVVKSMVRSDNRALSNDQHERVAHEVHLSEHGEEIPAFG